MRESELENRFRQAVKKAGGKAYKFVSPGNDGVPDRIVVLPGGRVGFVELKQTGKKPRKLQQLRIKELEELGCFTAVVDSEESALLVIESLNATPCDSTDRYFREIVNSVSRRRGEAE